MSKIKIKFEANKHYQLKAVESVVSLFTGMPKQEAVFQLGDDIIANLTSYQVLEEHWLYDNLHAVQASFNQFTTTLGSSTKITHPDIRLQVDDGSEGRKIDCAEKHFSAIGIDYGATNDRIETWWLSEKH